MWESARTSDIQTYEGGFQKKVSMTKINIGPKDVEFNIDKGFGWVSCDIQTYEAGFQAFFGWVSKKSMHAKINISSKDAEFHIYEFFSWVSCDI
jgi:hypothetical protein